MNRPFMDLKRRLADMFTFSRLDFFLNSRLARKIFWLLLFAVAMPVTGVVWLGQRHMNATLVEGSSEQLGELARSYGQTINERLIRLDGRLDEIANVWEILSAEQLRTTLRQDFDWVQLVDLKTGQVKRLFGEGAHPAMLANKASPAKLIIDSSGETAQIWLNRPLQAGVSQLYARILPPRLWGRQDEISGSYRYQVFDVNGRSLFDTIRAPTDSSQPTTAAARWSLFLDYRFSSPDWVISVSQPKDLVLSPVRYSQLMTGLWVLGLLLLTILVSTMSIRKMLEPVSTLITGTERIAKRDYGVQVEVRSNDEFGQLADSFNTMSAQVASQFQMLSSLWQIDRILLKNMDIRAVCQHLAQSMTNFLPGTLWAVLVEVEDHSGHPEVVLNWCTKDQQAINTHQAVIVPSGSLLGAIDGRKIEILDARSDPLPANLRPLQPHRPDRLIVCASRVEGRLRAAVICGVPQGVRFGRDQGERMREVATRLSVAISTIEREDALYRQSNYDDLTGLPNRRRFLREINKNLLRGKHRGMSTAVIIVDIDHFKRVNDSYGHPEGDVLLLLIAQRLTSCVNARHIVARLGGDEFGVLLQGNSTEELQGVAQVILNALGEPFAARGRSHYLSASMGISIAPLDGVSTDELIRNADTALNVVKSEGRGGYRCFDMSMHEIVQLRSGTEERLRHAVAHKELLLHYQPVIDMRSESVVAAEALVRWNRPGVGVVGPGEFIEIAEENGLIVEIGSWVLEEAIKQQEKWRKDGYILPRLSINVSAKQLVDGKLLQNLDWLESHLDVRPETLVFEITETAVMGDVEGARMILEQIQARGYGIALDDFGTGYSWLEYLTRLPFDTVKIDRRFTAQLPHGKSAVEAVRGVMEICERLDKNVIVEGVETAEQADFLKQRGCRFVQGYFYGKPMPEDEFKTLLQRTKRLRAVS